MMLSAGGPAFTSKKPIEDFEAGLGEVISTAASNAFDNSLVADFTREARSARALSAIGGALSPGFQAPASPTIEAATARERVKAAGVDLTVPDGGMPSDEFETLLALRQRQKKADAVLSRRPQTYTGWAAEMLGSFAGEAIDPINVAASFIPVVGPARYAAWVERAGSVGGRLATRAAVGGVEGAAGAVLLEPLNLALNTKYEPKYGYADSFMNIAFGTILGGGLHAVGGAVSDFVSPARREAASASSPRSRTALMEAVTAADGGRAIDVQPVFVRADPKANPLADASFVAEGLSRGIDVDEGALARAIGDVTAVNAGQTARPVDLVRTIQSMGGIRLTDRQGRVTSEGGDVRAIFDRRYPPGLVNNKRGVPLDYIREGLEEAGWFPGREGQTTTNDVLDLLSRWTSGDKPRHPNAEAVEDLGSVRDEMRAAGIAKTDSPEVAGAKLAQYRAEKAYADALVPEQEPPIRPDIYDPSTGYEPAEMAQIRQKADAAITKPDDGSDLDGEIDALNELIAMAQKRETLTEADQAALDLASEFEARASLSAASYRAAAACMAGAV